MNWMKRLLEWFCREELQEGILGDLEEKFSLDRERLGLTRARRRFVWQGLGFLRWRFRRKGLLQAGSTALWQNHLSATMRSLIHRKQFFAINLIGLTLAMACSLYCLILVQDEWQFDQFHAKKDITYRVFKHHSNPAEEIDMYNAETSGLLASTMLKEYPEVEGFCRIYPFEEVLTFHEDQHFRADLSLFVDSSFFNFFSFDLLQGDASTALQAPGSIVLTEGLAEQIFGDRNPVGEKVISVGDVEYHVTGVVKDPPRHSSIQFDQLISWSTTVPGTGALEFNWLNNWLAQATRTYVQLVPSADPLVLESKLTKLMEDHFPERADQYTWLLQPFADMYLQSSHIRYQAGLRLGSVTFIYILIISALLILLIVLFNYFNIALSRAKEHHREVGVRKVLGSTRWQLSWRFMLETQITTLIATGVAFFLLMFVLPYLNAATGKELPFSLLIQGPTLLTIFIMSSLLSVLIGAYPAVVLSSPPAAVIMRNVVANRRPGLMRNFLVAAQFGIAFVLLLGCLMVIRQTNFLKNASLGFDSDNLVVIDVSNEVGENAHVFEEKLRRYPGIKSVSMGRSAIGWGNYSTTFVPEGRATELGTRVLIVDPDFFPTYGIHPVTGRSFHPEGNGDSMSVIVNRTFVESAGWSDPLGKRVIGDGSAEGYVVVGMVEDFHYHSLATAAIEPLAIFFSNNIIRNATVRISSGSRAGALAHIRKVWDEVAIKTPLDFYFVDDWFTEQYRSEDQLLKTSTLYALISVFLCGLGLYGITALMLQRRKREISVRKVLGGTILSIVTMINKQVLLVLLLGAAIALPLGYVLVEEWLEDFAYHTTIDVGTIALLVALIGLGSSLIVSILAARTASANPSEVLKSS